jgi:hypothetical protein
LRAGDNGLGFLSAATNSPKGPGSGDARIAGRHDGGLNSAPRNSMLSALVDNATFVYVLLIIVCAGLLFAWRRKRRWGYLAGTAVGFILVIAFATLTQLYVTDLKKMESMIRATAAAIEHKDVDTIQHNLARDFRYHSADRKTFIEKTQGAIQRGDATKVDVWDFNLESMDKEKGMAILSFLAKPHGNWSEGVHYRVVGNLVREGDGQWRFQSFAIFKPFVDTKDEQIIPGF